MKNGLATKEKLIYNPLGRKATASQNQRLVLKAILGSKDKENVLQYLLAKKGYSAEIARFFNSNASKINKQLSSLEQEFVFVGFQVGKIRLYQLNPRYYFLKEQEALLIKARECYKPEFIEKLLYERIAPRRKGKPYIKKVIKNV
jgi:c-di-GMP-related signal transduction protein